MLIWLRKKAVAPFVLLAVVCLIVAAFNWKHDVVVKFAVGLAALDVTILVLLYLMSRDRDASP